MDFLKLHQDLQLERRVEKEELSESPEQGQVHSLAQEINFNPENYTQKTQNILQKSQSLALGNDHQKIMPEHLISAMLEDEEDLIVKIVNLCSGNFTLLKAELKNFFNKITKVSGAGSVTISVTISGETARILLLAEKIPYI